MPPVDSHTAGTISWADLVSTDLDAATAFCTGLLGWATEDLPMPGGDGVYRFFRARRLGGRPAVQHRLRPHRRPGRSRRRPLLGRQADPGRRRVAGQGDRTGPGGSRNSGAGTAERRPVAGSISCWACG